MTPSTLLLLGILLFTATAILIAETIYGIRSINQSAERYKKEMDLIMKTYYGVDTEDTP